MAAVIVTFLLALLGLGLLVSASSVAPAALEAPKTGVDMICHPDDPAECYPRVFQASDEFQVVKEGQELPQGLHVRLNIWTGMKEAKINVPSEEIPELSGLAVDSAVVLVDPEPAETPEATVPKGAPVYEAAGKIKQPTDESKAFHDSLSILKKAATERGVADAAFSEAVETLRDMSHDIYYGLVLTKDTEAVKNLFCLASGIPVQTTDGADEKWVFPIREAASTLSSAIQNNPTALEEISKSWDEISSTDCTGGGEAQVKDRFPGFDTLAHDGTEHGAARVRSVVSTLNGLLKSAVIRDRLLENDLMSGLLRLLMPREAHWDSAQAKVGQLIMDNFLDEDLGATLKIWPKVSQRSHAECAKLQKDEHQGLADGDGCWDYVIQSIAKRHGADDTHWSMEFLRLLRKQDSQQSEEETPKRSIKDEL